MSKPSPIATIHVDGSFVHVEWHRPAPNMCHMPVYPEPLEEWPPEIASGRYVVKVARSYPGSPDIHEEYLTAIRYDRYQRGDSNTHSTSRDIDEAFRFETLAAAEVAACFVGGDVIHVEQG